MASRIKGITVEIGGDTTGLDKALKGVNWIFRKNSTTVPKGRHAVPLQTACRRMIN
jgi:phage-related minor tail protein